MRGHSRDFGVGIAVVLIIIGIALILKHRSQGTTGDDDASAKEKLLFGGSLNNAQRGLILIVIGAIVILASVASQMQSITRASTALLGAKAERARARY